MIVRWTLAALGLVSLFSIAVAQEAVAPDVAPEEPSAPADVAEPVADYDAIQATIDRMQRRIEQMGEVASERDETLRFLEEQIERAAGRISGGEETQEALRQRAANLGVELESLAEEREALSEAVDERAALVANLESQIARLTELLAGERLTIGNLESELGAREAALTEVRSERDALEATLDERQAALADAEALNDDVRGELTLERAQRQALERRVATLESERQAAVAAGEAESAALKATLGERETALGVANERIALLNAQLLQLNRQLSVVERLLDSSDARISEQQTTIAALGQRLEQALIDQVEELSQYRSEFFGRLRQILGDRQEIRIVGDRFVFQSELLFASGSASIGPEGRDQLRALAQTLREVAERIPDDIPWVLSIDGHTDRVPVGVGSPFDSNWELSTARAISVVEFLIDQGIPPNRLAATGFGEYQPLDPRDDEIAYRRNRRIEFKLTSG